jgi:beta-glucosidase
MDIKTILSQMTLEEKAGLCSGADIWHTKAVERLGVMPVMMADGPHGLRKRDDEDPLGLTQSVPATCFPTAAALACSWDRELLTEVGEALGRECQAEKVSVLLGPGCNIKRSPLCGRNFEYFSEDPFLSSELAAAHISGVQSQGVGTSLKHFAANNQETARMNVDAVIDERALREIYLCAFEGAVKKAAPWTVMCAYNKLNGEYCSENRRLLTDILRDEWGYSGCVVSDWSAVNDRVKGLAAGLDIEMPASNGERDKKIVEAVKSGELPEAALDRAAERILRLIASALDKQKPGAKADLAAHHRLARKAARECIVLLKNEDGLLPLKKTGTLAVIGGFAMQPRYQGGGSSHVNPAYLDTPYEEIKKALQRSGAEALYAQGYRLDGEAGSVPLSELVSAGDFADEALIGKAVKTARASDAAVIFTGLPDSYESEGTDRKHMRIPEGHRALIEAVAKAQKNLIVVLLNGAPVEMPWIGSVKAVLEGYLGGQASGGAVADILFGDACPCGKLAETFPKDLADNPSYPFFPGERNRAEYREGIFVGYRYYQAKEMAPLFPFGFGLSYTEFSYGRLRVDKKSIRDKETVTVTVAVRNTGRVSGKETVELYVRDVKAGVIRPPRELKEFKKVALAPGEEKDVSFTLGYRAFAYYDPDLKDWNVESGEFEILIGKSSRDIVLKERISVESTRKTEKVLFTQNSTIGDILEYSGKTAELERLLGDFSCILPGCIRLADLPALFREMPLRSALVFFPGGFRFATLETILDILNGGD